MDWAERWNLIKFIGIILLVIAIGVFAVNQILEFRYKAVFLQKPCEVCKNLNSEQAQCIDKCFTLDIKLFPMGNGQWVDGLGVCREISTGKKINCSGGFNPPTLNITS